MLWLDVLFSIVILGGAFRGFRSGFIQQLFSTVTILIGIYLAPHIGRAISPVVESRMSFQLRPTILWGIGFFLTSIVLGLLLNPVAHYLERRFLSGVNRILGAALGVLLSALILSILCALYGQVAPGLGISVPSGSRFFTILSEIGQTILPSDLFTNESTARRMTSHLIDFVV